MPTNLFGLPVLPGLTACTEFVSESEERALIEAIDGAGLSPFRFQGWEGKRLTHSFGWQYDFDNGRFDEADPMPDWLIDVKDRAEQLAELAPGALVQALLIRYDVGAGIGWHRDRPVFDRVVGISLGNDSAMRFRRRTGKGFERVTLPLPRRGAYALRGEARHQWEHSIAAVDRPRWSITFRSLANPPG